MTWTNPPQSIIDARDVLLQTVTVTATILPALTLGQRQARCHYPKSDARTDTVPLFVFRRPRYEAKREQVTGYFPSGQIMLWLIVNDATVDDGTLEGYGESICQDLASHGFADSQYVITTECGEAIEPSPAMIASAVAGQPDDQGVTYRVISLSWNWEG